MKKEDVTEGGLVIVHKELAKMPQWGYVRAIGPWCDMEVLDIKIGDKVIYSKFAGLALTDDDGKEYLLVSQDECLAKVEDGDI